MRVLSSVRDQRTVRAKIVAYSEIFRFGTGRFLARAVRVRCALRMRDDVLA